MLTTPHLLVGAAIGTQFHNPMLIAPAAAASHFILDGIPHLGNFIDVHDLDRKDLAFVAADVAVGVSLVAYIANFSFVGNSELIWLGAFCSMLPDFHHTFQALFGPEKLQKYNKLHRKFHYKKDISLLPGMATQLATIIASLILVIK